MKRLLHILLLIPSVLFAQADRLDDLKRQLDETSDLSKRAELLNELSYLTFQTDTEQALRYADQAMDAGGRSGNTSAVGWAFVYRGCAHWLSGEMEASRDALEEGMRMAQERKDAGQEGFAAMMMANTFRDAGIFDQATHWYERADTLLSADRYLRFRAMLKNYVAELLLLHGDDPLTVLEESMTLRRELKDSIPMADLWILMGHRYRQRFQLEQAEMYYERARSAAPDDLIIESNYKEGMGEVAFIRGNFELSMDYWMEALEFHRGYGYQYPLARLLHRLGEVFEEEGYYDLATKYLLQARDIATRCGYTLIIADVYYQLGWVSFRSKNLEVAEQNVHIAKASYDNLRIARRQASCLSLMGHIHFQRQAYDSSQYYHMQSLRLREAIGDKKGVSFSLSNLGTLYLNQRQYARAMQYFRSGIRVDREIGDAYGTGVYLNRMSHIYMQQNQLDSAYYSLSESLKLATESNANSLIRTNYVDLASYHARIGEFDEAYAYEKKSAALADTLYNQQLAQSLSSYRTLNELEAREKEVSSLRLKNELTEETVRQQRWILLMLVAGGAVLLLTAIFYFFMQRRLRKLNLEIGEQNEEIQAQAEELNEAHHTLSELYDELAARNRSIELQARELAAHNEVISQLNESLEETVDERTAQLRKAYHELDTFFYRASHDFRRPLTTFMGLAEVAKITIKDTNALELFQKVNETARNLDGMLHKLQSISDVGSQQLIVKEVFLKLIADDIFSKFDARLAERSMQTGLTVVGDVPFYSYPALIAIVLENLIENAIEFSNSQQPFIRIRATVSEDEVALEVEDNGIGIHPDYQDRVFDMYFRASERSKGNGLGLYIVRKVLDRMEGTVTLKTSEYNGTVVHIRLPNLFEQVP